MKLKSFRLSLVCLGLMGFLSVSCLDTDNTMPIDDKEYGHIAVGNFSSDAGAINFKKNGSPIVNNQFNYGNYNGYYSLETGDYSFTIEKNNNPLDTITFKVKKNELYSLFAVNKLNNIEIVKTDDNITMPEVDKMLYRFIQLSPELPEITVKLEGDENSLGDFKFKDYSFFEKRGYFSNKKIYLINTETQDTLFSKNISLDQRKAYTIISKGLLDTQDGNQMLDIQVVGVNLLQ